MLVTIPSLYCPFEAKIHPQLPLIEQHTNDWIRSFDLLTSEEHYIAFKSYKFAKMTARTYPTASLAFINAASCLNTWLFVLDDMLDHINEQTEKIRDEKFLKKLVGDFVTIFRYNKLPNKSPETYNILASLEDIWQRFIPLTSPTWQSQFTISFTATFQAAFWEAENAVKHRNISLSSYKLMRQFFSGANLGTDMVEPATGIQLPYYVQQERTFMQCVELIRRVICWANDIFSLEKELAHGDSHNLVCVLANEYDISIEKAIDKAAELHDAEIAQFMQLKQELPSYGEAVDAQIQSYFLAMETMVKGFIDWSVKDSLRYIRD
ncbi:hypothetical protein LX64_02536 [Chitinophaga skermanii]|uniref:Terpene synthase n=1 Tax=Chitinophaga skermanii TaxID=331697 RepID=A0A327QMV9_9BACT|nr:hypothetical protein [Chitinophaga skermanii]RAJ05378.1 hypothetical protein LX64_02536 [Chitinophaga skermanii]